MDIEFSCSKCGQNIVVDEAGAGVEIPCPSCQTTLVIPSPQRETPVILTQLCPKCERAWPEHELVCDHCGTSLKEQPNTALPSRSKGVHIELPPRPGIVPTTKAPVVEKKVTVRPASGVAQKHRDAESESAASDGWATEESSVNKLGTYIVAIPALVSALLSWGMFGIQVPTGILCIVVILGGLIGGVLNLLGRGPVWAGAIIGVVIGLGGYGVPYWWMHGRESVRMFEVSIAFAVGAAPGFGLQYAIQMWLKKRAGASE